MAETINMPKLGFDMAEGTLLRWVRTEGEQINKGDVLAEIETDKATVEVESSTSGIVLRLLANQGDVVPVSSPIAIIGEPGEKIADLPSAPVEDKPAREVPSGVSPAPQPVPAPAPTKEVVTPSQPGFVRASPLAKRIARDKNIDLGNVQGSGPNGRIVRRDIEAALAGSVQTADRRAEAVSPPATVLRPSSAVDEAVPLTKLRQAIGRRLVEAKQQLPHFYVTHEYRMDALLAMRGQINGILPEGEKLSVNDFLVKAVALTLREYPNLNASLDGNNIIRHGAVNVGNAVAVEGGLLTVVCREADQKTLRQISLEVRGMAERVHAGKVRPEDIEGSTFSISNLGMYDAENFIAIINPPEAAILAVGSAHEVPVVEEGEIKAGWRMKATISVDHRISDGAEAARFMQTLARYLEAPLRLMV